MSENSQQKQGALAGLRFGAGLVTLVGENSIKALPFSLMQSSALPPNCTAVAMGMGLGDHADGALIEAMLSSETSADGPALLFDADLCYHPNIARLLERAPNAVVTPHPKEFAALLKTLGLADVDTAEIQRDRFGWARRFIQAYPDATLVLKGANTLIAHRDAIYINPHGTPVLAQAGSGDVLAGLIASLLAQGYAPLQAAIQGSLAHTLAARHYEGADYSAKAEDLIEALRWLK